jgi:hypothetical protein
MSWRLECADALARSAMNALIIAVVSFAWGLYDFVRDAPASEFVLLNLRLSLSNGGFAGLFCGFPALLMVLVALLAVVLLIKGDIAAEERNKAGRSQAALEPPTQLPSASTGIKARL